MHPQLTAGQFHGQTLRREEVAGLILSETRYAPGERLPFHSHANPYVCLVQEGRYTEIYGRRRRECRPWTLVFHPAGEVHAECFHDAPGRSFNIEFPPAWAERVRQHSDVLEHPLEFRSGQLTALAARVYDESLRGDAVTPLAVEGLALELLALAARHLNRPRGRRPPPWLRQVREFLHARYTDNLSLGEIAAAAGVHPAHLAATFRRHQGCSVGDYLRRLRVEAACRLLTTTALPLPEVAVAAGFAGHSHFARTFKSLTGTTPSRYRRSGGAG